MKTYEKPQLQVLNLTADAAMAAPIEINPGDTFVSDTTSELTGVTEE